MMCMNAWLTMPRDTRTLHPDTTTLHTSLSKSSLEMLFGSPHIFQPPLPQRNSIASDLDPSKVWNALDYMLRGSNYNRRWKVLGMPGTFDQAQCPPLSLRSPLGSLHDLINQLWRNWGCIYIGGGTRAISNCCGWWWSYDRSFLKSHKSPIFLKDHFKTSKSAIHL